MTHSIWIFVPSRYEQRRCAAGVAIVVAETFSEAKQMLLQHEEEANVAHWPLKACYELEGTRHVSRIVEINYNYN